MARSQIGQAQRTQSNPLVLGTFNTTALRYLRGSLGPQNKVIGRADTNQQSNGGFGGGTYNHWFQINLSTPGWIIVTKGPPRPKYIQVSAYDLNKNPIESRPIFEADSLETISDGTVYIPYLDTVMNVQSDLYNTFDRLRLDKGDDRYYPLNEGSYLICVSSTRNEPLTYEVGIVVEFPTDQVFFELEDDDGSVCVQEAYSSTGTEPYNIVLEPGDDAYYTTTHDHSLSEWQDAWEREHQIDDRFPDVFVPLTNRP